MVEIDPRSEFSGAHEQVLPDPVAIPVEAPASDVITVVVEHLPSYDVICKSVIHSIVSCIFTLLAFIIYS